jgi:organic hydroperoxide reductase OsmC/OhrA
LTVAGKVRQQQRPDAFFWEDRMSEHRAALRWERTSPDFTYESYNRAHEVLFKNGAITLPSSSAPEFRGDAQRVDPEEAYVASLCGCHMLTFLAICARKRLTVELYSDEASGWLQKNDGGKLWMTRVILRPRVQFANGIEVNETQLTALHHQAHADCFIANSVKTDVVVEPR